MVLFLQYDSIIQTQNQLEVISKINMYNRIEKISFIKKNIEIGKKYKYEDGRIFLKYIIIGDWINPPYEKIFFYKNHKYLLKDISTNYKEEGFWDIKDGKLILGKNKSKRNSYIIDYFVLEYDEDSTFKFSFNIVFKDMENSPLLIIEFD